MRMCTSLEDQMLNSITIKHKDHFKAACDNSKGFFCQQLLLNSKISDLIIKMVGRDE